MEVFDMSSKSPFNCFWEFPCVVEYNLRKPSHNCFQFPPCYNVDEKNSANNNVCQFNKVSYLRFSKLCFSFMSILKSQINKGQFLKNSLGSIGYTGMMILHLSQESSFIRQLKLPEVDWNQASILLLGKVNDKKNKIIF